MLSEQDQELIEAAARGDQAALSQRLAGGRRGAAHARRTHRTPASISTPISAAWRCAPRRLRSAARSPRSARPGSTPSWRCAIPSRTETDRTIAVVSPCGSCRELIWDYDRNARVIVPGPNGPAIVTIGELLAEQVQPGAHAVRMIREHAAPPPGHRRAPRGRHGGNLAAPAAAVGVHRPAAGAREPVGVHRGGAHAQRSARPRAVRRAAGARQDHAGADRGARAGRRFPRHLRARSSPRPAISPRCSPTSKSATCCSSTRSTGSIRRSRKSSIRRWRISSST